MGLFDKKYCSVCGDKIGLLGNRKLEDGNLCKSCASKLSPFFSERKSSTVAQIKEQLAYREENKSAVSALHITRSFGDDTKLLIDEDARKFVVTRSHNLAQANPDVIDYSMVTGVDIEIDEDADEEFDTDKDGNSVSYNPPRYYYNYDFNIVIRVNHPYFDTVKVELASGLQINSNAVPLDRKPDPMYSTKYRQCKESCEEIKEMLMGARQRAREEAAAAPEYVKCPCCGATTKVDRSGCCAYCGSPVK